MYQIFITVVQCWHIQYAIYTYMYLQHTTQNEIASANALRRRQGMLTKPTSLVCVRRENRQGESVSYMNPKLSRSFFAICFFWRVFVLWLFLLHLRSLSVCLYVLHYVFPKRDRNHYHGEGCNWGIFACFILFSEQTRNKLRERARVRLSTLSPSLSHMHTHTHTHTDRDTLTHNHTHTHADRVIFCFLETKPKKESTYTNKHLDRNFSRDLNQSVCDGGRGGLKLFMYETWFEGESDQEFPISHIHTIANGIIARTSLTSRCCWPPSPSPSPSPLPYLLRAHSLIVCVYL